MTQVPALKDLKPEAQAVIIQILREVQKRRIRRQSEPNGAA